MSRNGRILIGILTILIAIPSASVGQIIENPSKPRAADAGRVIAPEEVSAISDEGTSDYYFKFPAGLQAGPGGTIVLRDRDQVLRFDGEGKFLGNLLKKGQGPGEVNSAGSCLATDANMIMISRDPNKIVFFDLAGKFEKEISIRQQGLFPLSTLLLYQGGEFVFRALFFPETFGEPKIIDAPQTIVALSESTGKVRTLSTFMTKAWVYKTSKGGGGFDITILITVPFRDKLLALTHTEEYLLKIYDPATDQVLREFRRTYERINSEPLAEGGKEGKQYPRPNREFENDIKNVLARGNEIWAVTSTKDKSKGILLDVFDGDGIYRDCFWLKLPEPALRSILSPGQCALDGEYLWVVERAEDDTCKIKKYRVGS